MNTFKGTEGVGLVEATDPSRLATDLGAVADAERWLLLVAPDPDQAVGEITDTLDAVGIGYTLVPPESRHPVQMLKNCAGSKAVVWRGPDHWPPNDYDFVEIARDRLRAQFTQLLLVTTRSNAQLLAARCPNFFSYFQGDALAWTDGSMGPDQVETYLAGLRKTWDLTDEELVAQAEEGNLAPHPDKDAWLVLLGRGDLLGAAAARELRGADGAE